MGRRRWAHDRHHGVGLYQPQTIAFDVTKRSIITWLAVVNALLVTALVLASRSDSLAFAQGAGRSGGFVSVTAKASGQSYDVVYVLDVPGRKLYGYYPVGGQGGKIKPTPPRDLMQDFGKQ